MDDIATLLEQIESLKAELDRLKKAEEAIAEFESLPKEWEGSGYNPQQMGRIVKKYQELQVLYREALDRLEKLGRVRETAVIEERAVTILCGNVEAIPLLGYHETCDANDVLREALAACEEKAKDDIGDAVEALAKDIRHLKEEKP